MICLDNHLTVPRLRNFKTLFFFCVLVFLPDSAKCQQTPINPISYRVYSPFVLNPAIAGSKDYFLIEGIATFQGPYKSQLVTGNTRLLKKTPAFFSSPDNKDYTCLGVGGTIFNDVSDTSKSIGFSASAAYHISLNKQSTSFLSLGVALKGIYNRLYSTSPADTSSGPQETFLPNIDLGVYYYGAKFYAGISATNLLSSPDSLGIPVSREYFLITGYKLVISRTLNIVAEPSIIAHTGNNLPSNIKNIINPMLKIYIESCCFGTYFHDYDNFSFFFLYNFPAISIGTYFEYPKNTPYYKKELNAELTIGINLSELKLKNKKPLHW
jgi:type IX secretion system PorP/SprF family membrane protein